MTCASAASSSHARSAAMPAPVTADVSTRAAPRERRRRKQLRHLRPHLGDASRADAIDLGNDRETTRTRASRSTMARCSRVCGITPSSAATTSSTASMPHTPASMLRTKRSWPGTSTKPSVRPAGVCRYAKPRSMEMPRAFSCGSRSVSTPVNALTSVVLPWSTCPAVATIMRRLRPRTGASPRASCRSTARTPNACRARRRRRCRCRWRAVRWAAACPA